MSQVTLESMRLKNFKAIRDSGDVIFTPLTVFIGNNGSGKSSLIEGLQTYQQILMNGLYDAMNRWHGFENIHNPPIQVANNGHNSQGETYSTEFSLTGNILRLSGDPYNLSMTLQMSVDSDQFFIANESLDISGKKVLQRDQSGNTTYRHPFEWSLIPPGWSMLNPVQLLRHYQIDEYPSVSELAVKIADWQFLTLNPYAMGDSELQNRIGSNVRLKSDGSNIANYLLDIRKWDQSVFNGIIETLRYVLPYAEDIQPTLTSELERDVYLQLTEGQMKIPGHLLSTGTLRVLALLAVLKHPEPYPLIVIEEIENGLDPRTINLIVEEMRGLTESGTTQIIVTTHSPYFLDLLDLEQIVVVERIDGQPTFFRPSTDQALQKWAESFTPGRLYTMSQLTRRSAG